MLALAKYDQIYLETTLRLEIQEFMKTKNNSKSSDMIDARK